MNTPRRTAAFTLIEILVVVGIIALLVAILIPALSAARNTAKKTATTAQMSGISTACESYYQNFQAYPGALSDALYDNNASNITFSSSQSMLVSMSRQFFAGPSPATPPTFTLQVTALNFWTCDNPSASPKDYSVGTGQTYQPLLTPSAPQLSSAIGLFANTTPKKSDIPVLIDSSYGADALPILYYRAARKYDPSVQDSKGRFMSAVGDSGNAGSAPFAAFYGASNDYVFSQQSKMAGTTFGNAGALKASDAAQNSSANGTDINGGNGPYAQALVNDLFSLSGTGTNKSATPKGSFVLVSAGPDRIYGPRSTLPTTDSRYDVNSTTADDIIVAGGN
ncbi:MAG: type II secretion system protein [Phycisphaerae bacterium]